MDMVVNMDVITNTAVAKKTTRGRPRKVTNNTPVDVDKILKSTRGRPKKKTLKCQNLPKYYQIKQK